MSLWGSKDQANNAPKYKILPNSPDNGNTLFGTVVVGVDNGEAANGNVAHAGWQRVVRGTGPVLSMAVGAGGTGYDNADIITVTGGTVNASATLTTNSTGGITNVAITDNGSGFSNVSSANVTITTSAGANASISVTLGGRAGRVSTEVLVAMGSMTQNNSGIEI